MSTALDRRIPLSEAERLAHQALELLAPACERIEIAGSIRRRKLDVGDVELLAIPKVERQLGGLFGDEPFDVNQLDLLVLRLLEERRLFLRAPRRLGSKYKALLLGEMPLDLFCVLPPAEWGCLMAIRTGPREFSQRLVTDTRHYGLRPPHLKVVDGGVYHELQKPGVDKPYPMPEERDLFELFRLEYVPPERRA